MRRIYLIMLVSLLLIIPFVRDITSTPDHRLYSSWVEGEETRFFVVPLLASALPFSSSFSLKIVSVILFIGIIFLTYLIGKKIDGEFLGLVSAAIIGLNPLVLRETIQGLLDVPVTFFFCLSIYLYLVFRDNHEWNWGLAFLVSSMITILTKNTGSLIFPVIIAIFLYDCFKDKRVKEEGYWLVPVALFTFWFNYFQVRNVFLTLSEEPLNDGMLTYLSYLSPIKIVAAFVFLGIAFYVLKNSDAVPSLWFFGYLVGFIAVQPALVVTRHFMPCIPALILILVLFAENMASKLKIDRKYMLVGYGFICLLSVILSIQHMSRFVGVF